MQKPEDLITAAEIACFAYCPEQWRLQYGLDLDAGNRAAMDAGTRHHGRKAIAERIAGLAIALGQLILVAGLVLFLWMLLR
jgi:hypothetical protein